jgi:histidine triad (HIT) family protein
MSDDLMAECIFCDIIADRQPGVKLYEDDVILAIEDIHPRTPVHLLIMPKRHVPTLLDIQPDDTVWVSAIPFVANRLAREHGIADSGFRLVANVNRGGGQVIFHVHFHLMGGRYLRWPP